VKGRIIHREAHPHAGGARPSANCGARARPIRVQAWARRHLWSTYTHIPGLLAHPHAELVALCDTNPDKLQAAARAYGVQNVYASASAMFYQEALDGVVIATPHATHFTLAQDGLARGLHVLLEKPMTLRAAEARTLVTLARAQECELILGDPWHYTPQALRARELIRSGRLGAVQYVSCTVTSSIARLLQGDDGSDKNPVVFPVHGPGAVYSDPALSGGGQGHLQITHSAGLLFFVTGLQVQHVLALMRNHGLPLDLVDVMLVAFEGDALGMRPTPASPPPRIWWTSFWARPRMAHRRNAAGARLSCSTPLTARPPGTGNRCG